MFRSKQKTKPKEFFFKFQLGTKAGDLVTCTSSYHATEDAARAEREYYLTMLRRAVMEKTTEELNDIVVRGEELAWIWVGKVKERKVKEREDDEQ